jgi:hypothetical protein
MKLGPLLGLSAAALAISTIAGYAGSCSPEIDRMQARIDARIEAVARTGPMTTESSAALLHRQPTPDSIAAAESRLGELSPEQVAAVRAAMVRAHEADGIGDKAACDRALAEVQGTIGP